MLQSKDIGWQNGLKKNLSAAYKRFISDSKTLTDGKGGDGEILMQMDVKRKLRYEYLYQKEKKSGCLGGSVS